MRNRGILLGATLALGLMALAGCDNTQGTSANPDMLPETTTYTDNNNPQNTGAGAGTMAKPKPMTGNMMGGDSPSQAQVKGTDNSNDSFPASATTPANPQTPPGNATPTGAPRAEASPTNGTPR